MTSLTKQLQSAEAGSCELDAKIWRALNMQPDWYYDSDMGGYCYMPETGKLPSGDALYSVKPLPAVTTSLDAALALVKEVLPAWDWGINRETEDVSDRANKVWFEATLQNPEDQKAFLSASHQGAPAIALCLALLSAAAVEGSDG